MFELIKNVKRDYFNICVNKVTYLYSHVYDIKRPSTYISKDKEVNQELLKCKVKDFKRFDSISLENVFDWIYYKTSLDVSPNYEFYEKAGNLENKKTGKIDIDFYFEPDLLLWKENFSFSEYYEEFKVLYKSVNLLNGELNFFNEEDVSFSLKIVVPSFSISIGEFLLVYTNELRKIHEKIIANLETREDVISLSSEFNFPSEIKTYCEQYLIYFAQFLQDLGINATSNLKEEAGKVLFSITPTDDVEALDKIREALAIYLSLSSNPLTGSTGDRTVDMVLSGARANAKHLESQLELAIAKLQFKEATLELKDSTIEQHQLALRRKDETIKELQEIVARGNIFEESLERVEINGEVVDETSLYRFSRADDIEVEATPILEIKTDEIKVGLIKFHEVTKLKEYGVSFDLAKAIRDLMDFFKRDKKK